MVITERFPSPSMGEGQGEGEHDSKTMTSYKMENCTSYVQLLQETTKS